MLAANQSAVGVNAQLSCMSQSHGARLTAGARPPLCIPTVNTRVRTNALAYQVSAHTQLDTTSTLKYMS